MVHTTQDFFNKVAKDIRSTYFPNENHGTTENKNYWKTTKILEDFNNSNLTYKQLIGRLSKTCEDTTENLHTLVEKYIISFGSYEYKPKKSKTNETK